MAINKIRVDNVDYNIEDSNARQSINDINRDLGTAEGDIQTLKNSVDSLETEKADRTEIPDVSEFIKNTVDNLVNYYKKSETYTQAEVNQIISAIKTISMKVVPERPTTGETNVIYLVPRAKSETENIYDEWIYVSEKWEKIGSTDIDLSGYYTKEQIDTLLFDYITSNDLEEALNNYVLKEENKGLSTNDYTDEDKEKVDNSAPASEIERLDEKIKEIELTKFPNMTIHGEPTINNGQVSNFTTENYLSFPAIFDLHDRGFEFNFAVRTSDDVATAQNILGSKFCIALLIESAKLKLRVSSNGTSWDLVDIQSNIDILANTMYYFRISFDRLTYKLFYSLNDETYIEVASEVASISPKPSQIYLGIGNNFHNPFKGMVNLNKCYLKVNNSVIWRGLDDAGLQTRADLDLSNISVAGEERIKELVKPEINNVDDKVIDTRNELERVKSELNNYATKTYVDEKIGVIDTELAKIDTGVGVE